MFKWWAVPFMVLRQGMLPFNVQRTKSTTAGILIHFISDELSVLLSIIPLLTAELMVIWGGGHEGVMRGRPSPEEGTGWTR
jgi:hypothetical protein